MGFEHSFFKVIRSSEKMEVPEAIVWRMGGAPSRRCMLRDGNRNVWLVEVSSQDDKWFFHKGWAELCREKSLNVGDILLFENLGNNLFHFKLFGKGESTNLGRGEQEEEEEHQESEHSEEDDVNDDDYVKEDEDDDDDDEDEQVHISKKIKREPRQSANTTIGAETLSSKRRYKKQNIPDCYGEEIFKSGLASRPDNPYFVSRSRALTRKNELYIPKEVIVDHQLNIPENMCMVDERGWKWETKMKQWKDGRVWCTKGWKSLRRVNDIKADDICICEFQGRDTDMSLHVHVLDKLL